LEKEKNQNPNTLYLAACILFELGDLDSALDSVEKAMEKLEDHLMRYLYLIALIMALKGKYKEAYKAFSNVLGLLNDMK
jgi:tetratricopeptide (TPR) repeat protein